MADYTITENEERQLNGNISSVMKCFSNNNIGTKLREMSIAVKYGGGGGLTPDAASLLIEILRNGVYTSDKRAKIDQLEEELSREAEYEVRKIDDTLYINKAPARQTGNILFIY